VWREVVTGVGAVQGSRRPPPSLLTGQDERRRLCRADGRPDFFYIREWEMRLAYVRLCFVLKRR
jgi:hypothetical protein